MSLLLLHQARRKSESRLLVRLLNLTIVHLAMGHRDGYLHIVRYGLVGEMLLRWVLRCLPYEIFELTNVISKPPINYENLQ